MCTNCTIPLDLALLLLLVRIVVQAALSLVPGLLVPLRQPVPALLPPKDDPGPDPLAPRLGVPFDARHHRLLQRRAGLLELLLVLKAAKASLKLVPSSSVFFMISLIKSTPLSASPELRRW